MSFEELKATGNALFSSGKFLEAKDLYTKACELEPSVAVTWANRSACYLSLRLFVEAEVDARRCIELDPSYSKGYYRLAVSLIEQNRLSEAQRVLKLGLQIDPLNKAFKSLRIKCDAELKQSMGDIASAPHDEVTDGAVSTHQCADLNCHKTLDNPLAVCQTCTNDAPRQIRRRKPRSSSSAAPTTAPPVFSPSEYAMFSSLKTLVKSIKGGSRDFGMFGGSNMLRGKFSQLLDPVLFRDLLFPGSPKDVLEVLPKDLCQLLQWQALSLDLPKVAKSAAKVLDGVKKRGAMAGDTMDPQTESMLTPQILQEALALELVDAVKHLSKLLSIAKAKLSLSLADAAAKAIFFRTVDVEVVLDDGVGQALLASGVSEQRDCLGQDWTNIIFSDCKRYLECGDMSLMSAWDEGDGCILPKVAWVERDRIAELYPALAEAIRQMQVVAFELNEQTANELRLLTPTTGCTMLLHFPVGSKQPRRLDNAAHKESGDAVSDSGIRTTCSYHLLAEACGDSSPSTMAFSSLDLETTVDVVNDMLLLHQSTIVQNSRSVARMEYFVLQYFFHGQV